MGSPLAGSATEGYINKCQRKVDDQLTLERTVEQCRQSETKRNQQLVLFQLRDKANVDAVKQIYKEEGIF